MKAAVLKEKNIFEIKEVPKPILEGKGAVIRIIGCGLCGSDVVKMRTAPKEGMILGHEIVGIIEEINTETNFRVGDKVVLGHHVPCFNCEYCRGESYSMCRTFKKTNIKPGGFCEYLKISEAHLKNTVCKVEAGMSDIVASFTEPLSCCIRAVKRAEIKEGDTVLIVGLGSIGILMGQAAKAYGARIIGCDILQERLAFAKKSGFDETVLYQSNETTAELLKKKINAISGVDKVILTAGNDNSVDFAVKSVRDGGTILVFASIKSNDKGFANNEIYYRELTVRASYSPSPADIKESFSLLKSGRINVESLTTIYELSNLNQAVADFVGNKILKAYIKI